MPLRKVRHITGAVFAACAPVVAMLAAASAVSAAPLEQMASIPMPGVKGRIDHFALDRDGHRLFVAALGNGSVEVIDTVANRHLRSIPGFGEPQGLAYIPGAHRLFVSNGSGDRVDVLDARSLRPVQRISNLRDADNLRYDASTGRVIVGYGKGALRLMQVDRPQSAVEVRLTAHPESFQLEKHGSRVFVNVPDARQVAVVDRVKAQIVATWEVRGARANFPMALDEAGRRLFVGARSPAVLLVYDIDNGKVVSRVTIGGDTDDIFIDAQRRRVYVICGEGRIDVLKQVRAPGAVCMELSCAYLGFFDDEEMRLFTELAGDIAFALDHIAKAEKLDYLAYYDALTGLANRTLLRERLSQHLEAAAQSGANLALIVCDVERMAAINESFGRPAGDLLLTKFCERLVVAVGDAKQIARTGGDHFAIIVPNSKGALEVAHTIGDLAKRSFGEPFQIGETELRLSAKAGIAMFSRSCPGRRYAAQMRRGCPRAMQAERRPAALLRAVDDRTRREQFGPGNSASPRARARRVRAALPAAGRRPDEAHYRRRGVDPLAEQRRAGASCEIHSAAGGNRPHPGSRGLGVAESGAGAKKWLAQGIAVPRLAVNVSAVQLKRRDFVPSVTRAIASGTQPPGIDIEITESMVMVDVAGNIEKLQAVRDLGISVAIDDFGTGYSSLAYLTRLPVNSLKIDRSFVITMLNDRNTMTLVSTIVSLAHSLDLKVVAEGVETEEQAAVLRKIQCDEMQGYLYSKPLPPDGFIKLLTGDNGGR